MGVVAPLCSTGCTDTGSAPGAAENLTLSISSSHTHTSLASPGHQALAISSAKVLIRDIETLRFTLHKPEDHEPVSDPDFRDGPGDDQRFSIIVTGFYHETPFVYKSLINAHQDLKLPLPIEVPSEGYVNVTMKIDPYAWFTVGELVLDPFIQGREIDDRVVSSFASEFRDNDRNGEPD